MKKRPKSLQQVFDQSKFAQPKYDQKADYNSQLQHELANYLPPEWQGQIFVKSYSDGILELAIANAALKMRFNAFRLDLLSHLRTQIPELISIRDKVDPKAGSHQQSPNLNQVKIEQSVNARPLSEKSKSLISQSMQTMPDELQQALARLVKISKSGK
ncbi:hypothetical protein HR060_06825 [Catenovulum sp. SM1970]|uniref:DUF721 domain-containing protein n=1 Tax=Marinifaba aquimaris TaxID=2741323 RepID=UPI00157493C5|nr:hypothetical protein [Marinifaba aquimaris]NTS76580.1 hypothetical protein [Marinifaba aquimaris]